MPTHRHKCGHCGYIIEHDDVVRLLPKPELLAAHKCPICSRHQGRIYIGKDKVTSFSGEPSTQNLQPAHSPYKPIISVPNCGLGQWGPRVFERHQGLRSLGCSGEDCDPRRLKVSDQP